MQLKTLLLLPIIIGTFVSVGGLDFDYQVLGRLPFIEVSYASSTPIFESKKDCQPNTGEMAIESEDLSIVRPRLTHTQETWLSALEWCESQGNSKIRIVDINGWYSYGAYQFQSPTFLGFGKQYKVLPEDMTLEQARGKDRDGPIYNSDVQRTIVAFMVEDGLDYHWTNCRNKIGHYPED